MTPLYQRHKKLLCLEEIDQVFIFLNMDTHSSSFMSRVSEILVWYLEGLMCFLSLINFMATCWLKSLISIFLVFEKRVVRPSRSPVCICLVITLCLSLTFFSHSAGRDLVTDIHCRKRLGLTPCWRSWLILIISPLSLRTSPNFVIPILLSSLLKIGCFLASTNLSHARIYFN